MEDLKAWLDRHTFAHNVARVQRVIQALKADGVQHFGSTGYCYGGRIIFDLVYAGELDVAAMSHPSFIQIDDLEVRSFPSRSPVPPVHTMPYRNTPQATRFRS